MTTPTVRRRPRSPGAPARPAPSPVTPEDRAALDGIRELLAGLLEEGRYVTLSVKVQGGRLGVARLEETLTPEALSAGDVPTSRP